MKTIRLIIAGFALMLMAGCYHYHEYPVEPVARFTVSDYVVEIHQKIYFTNNSLNADYFEWDFGDGYVTNVPNPSHNYDFSGTYTVSLTAFFDGLAHTTYQTITVQSSTILEITVLEYYDEYAVPDASIILYPTLNDWYNQTNAVIKVYSDYYGVAVIKDLPPQAYYVDVWHPEHNNYILAEEDVRYIRIPPLIEHGTTFFTAWVDYVPEGWKKKGEAVQSLKKARTFKENVKQEAFETKK
ncbi:MAG: PKD domain-containing protein [Bacteroidales bacterium]|nr:PKD domain-containing protein [Bacteroidales bacterium]